MKDKGLRVPQSKTPVSNQVDLEKRLTYFRLSQGNALKDAGRVDEAITCYQTSLALQPNHPQALTNLGNIYMEW